MTFGWRYEFRTRTWQDVRRFLCDVDEMADRGGYLLSIIDSVLEHGADELLALTTSMHDLVIALRPVDDPPLDVIVVAAPGSARSHPDGTIRIDYIAVNGENTEIVRPTDEALPLFWRFLRTEFGLKERAITPRRPCGHEAMVFDDVELRCGHYGCTARPASTIVYLGTSIADQPCWQIVGSCPMHIDHLLDTIRHSDDRLRSLNAETRIDSPSIEDALDWIHDDPSRCRVDCFSVWTPPI